MRLGAIGDNCLDVYMQQDLLTVGGNALNVAANWASAGLATRYLGAVGDDAAADAVKAGLRAAGLDPSDVVTLSGATGVTLIELIGSDRNFLFEEFGVGLTWNPSDEVLDDISRLDWVHVAGIATGARMFERLAERKARFSVDLSTYHDFTRLDGVEIAFASWVGELDGGAHELAARMTELGAETAVVTCGPHGSLVRTGPDTTTTKAHPIDTVDTCGAGDSFIAAYIESHLLGNDVQISLIQATASATRTCLHVGGFPQQQQPVPDWLKTTYYRFAQASPA